MQTKFTQLVKVKKQKVLECQKKIIRKNYEIALAKERCGAIKDEILQVKNPINGTFKEMLQTQEIKRIHTQELDRIKSEIENLEIQKKALTKALTELMIEHEKAKHLDDIEVERVLKENQKKEAGRINEVALMLYNNRSRSVE